MTLEGKTAVVYGAGSIGGTAARAFAKAGATVHVGSRTKKRLDKLAEEIRSDGGAIKTSVVDALDEKAVNDHMDTVAEAGGVDICFNAIQHGDVQGTPMVDMKPDDYLAPVVNGVTTTFLTSTAAARHMAKDGGGVILIFGGSGPNTPILGHSFGGVLAGFEAMEAMRRQMATEFAKDGIRVVTIQTSGIAESIPEDMENGAEIRKMLDDSTLTGKAATFDEVGNALVFAASDQAKSMTGGSLNITAGAIFN